MRAPVGIPLGRENDWIHLRGFEGLALGPRDRIAVCRMARVTVCSTKGFVFGGRDTRHL